MDHPISVGEASNLIGLNFTLALIAMNELRTSENQLIKGPRVGIFSNNIYHYGSIDATALGCGSDQGLGKGV